MIFCQWISAEAAETLARRINSVVAKKRKGNMLHITVSVGVYVTRATDDLEAIIKLTENALFQAKERGKNQVYVSNAL